MFPCQFGTVRELELSCKARRSWLINSFDQDKSEEICKNLEKHRNSYDNFNKVSIYFIKKCG